MRIVKAFALSIIIISYYYDVTISIVLSAVMSVFIITLNKISFERNIKTLMN